MNAIELKSFLYLSEKKIKINVNFAVFNHFNTLKSLRKGMIFIFELHISCPTELIGTKPTEWTYYKHLAQLVKVDFSR